MRDLSNQNFSVLCPPPCCLFSCCFCCFWHRLFGPWLLLMLYQSFLASESRNFDVCLPLFALHITNQGKKRIRWSVEEKKRNGGKQRTWCKKAQKKPSKLHRSYPPALLATYIINLYILTIWYEKALADCELYIKSKYTICIRKASFLKGQLINLACCAWEILLQHKMKRELYFACAPSGRARGVEEF